MAVKKVEKEAEVDPRIQPLLLLQLQATQALNRIKFMLNAHNHLESMIGVQGNTDSEYWTLLNHYRDLLRQIALLEGQNAN